MRGRGMGEGESCAIGNALSRHARLRGRTFRPVDSASGWSGGGAQVGVVSVDPVLAGRVEDVEVDGVFEREGFVGDVRRDAEDFAGADGDFAAFEMEFKGAVEDVGDLLVMVAVERDVGAFLEEDAGDHDVGANHELAADEVVHGLDFDVGPAG